MVSSWRRAKATGPTAGRTPAATRGGRWRARRGRIRRRHDADLVCGTLLSIAFFGSGVRRASTLTIPAAPDELAELSTETSAVRPAVAPGGGPDGSDEAPHPAWPRDWQPPQPDRHP